MCKEERKLIERKIAKLGIHQSDRGKTQGGQTLN